MNEDYPIELIDYFTNAMEYEFKLGLIGEEEKKQLIKNFIIELDIAWNKYLKENN